MAARKCKVRKMADFAIIDIGSNSVRLMTIADGIVLYKTLNTTRLGEGLANSILLREDAIERTAIAVKEFYLRAKNEGAKEVYAFATAAVRTAENGRAFVKRVKELCSLDVEIVSGEREARLGISGALGKEDGGVLDVGGASTELVLQKEGKIIYAKSVDIGVVRLKDTCQRDFSALTSVSKENAKLFCDAPIENLTIHGIGGTATTLAALLAKIESYAPEKVTGITITKQTMRLLASQLTEEMSVEEIAALPCVTKKRADVLGGGATLIWQIMESLQVDKIVVSDGDNLEGYAKEKGLL